MPTTDNRIRFPATRIDFENDVGLTGQDHDDYPAAGGQARYDWMRMFLVGLLSCQSSEVEPTQCRAGTLWFDLTSNVLKVYVNSTWVSLADAIGLTEPDSDGNVVTLSSWYAEAQDLLAGLAAEVVFSGTCTADGITTVEIPSGLRAGLETDSRVFLYVNGALITPTNCTIIGNPLSTIRLSGVSLSNGDSFTAVIRRVPAGTFYSSNVVVP